MKKLKIFLVAGAATLLSSCDLTQIPGLDGKLSVEDSKAIGAACRHAGRALEDCFALNPKGHQSGVFEGWREMNDYMVANQIEVIKPEIQMSAFKPAEEAGHADESAHSEGKSAGEGGKSHADSKKNEDSAHVASRPRWTPKTPGVASESPAADIKPQSKPEEKVEEKASPVVDEKTRPWERKKEKADPKSHT